MATYKLELYNDLSGIDKVLKTYQYALKVAKTALKDNEKLKKEVERELQYIADSNVDEFYAYDTEYDIHRLGDLYNAYKVRVSNTEWDIEYDSSFMNGGHRAGNDVIFENSFMQGYHGGAFKGPNHPDPGTPYLRTPPHFDSWLRPAVQTDSPYKNIEASKDKYLEKQINKYDKNIYNPLDMAIDNLLKDIEEEL